MRAYPKKAPTFKRPSAVPDEGIPPTVSKSSRLRTLGCAIALSLVALSCSEPLEEDIAPGTSEASDVDTTEEPPTTGAPDNTTVEPDSSEEQPSDDGSVVFDFAGEEWSLGTIPTAAVPADDSLEPIKLGMINQENTPLGSFPEMRGAALAAAEFVNAELGGIDGRPIELIACITSFSVEQSQACAQQMIQEGVVALVGGIDVTSNGSIPVLQQNGIPTVGGVPVNLVEQQSPINFFFSGGGAGGAAAFLAHAAENGAETVVVAYGEFESFEIAARDYGGAVGEMLGLNVELVSFPIIGADYLPILTTAAELDADALVVLAADTACIPVMEGAKQLELRAQLYMVGGCAAETIIEAAGDNIEGVLFNSEGPLDPDDPEGNIYQAVVDTYATGPAGGVGTVGFRSFMNMYLLLDELGGDNISSQSIIDLVSSGEERTSYWGHPYICDGKRVPGLPALCAPEQILFNVPPGGLPTQASEWIETDDLFQAAITE